LIYKFQAVPEKAGHPSA